MSHKKNIQYHQAVCILKYMCKLHMTDQWCYRGRGGGHCGGTPSSLNYKVNVIFNVNIQKVDQF